MEEREVIEKLGRLVRLDRRAHRLFEQAARRMTHAGVRSRLEQMGEEHRERAEALCRRVRDLGATPPERAEGAAHLPRDQGVAGVLESLLQHEAEGGDAFSDALAWNVSHELRVLLFAHYEEERSHVELLERLLRDRPWDQQPTI